jgi:hypothetical protein
MSSIGAGLVIETQSLPSLPRCYPRAFTVYVADPISSIETRSLPALARSYPRHFTFYVADPSAPFPVKKRGVQAPSALKAAVT